MRVFLITSDRPLALIDEEQTLIASRRGEDPYVKSLSIAPKGLFYKGNRQVKKGGIKEIREKKC